MAPPRCRHRAFAGGVGGGGSRHCLGVCADLAGFKAHQPRATALGQCRDGAAYCQHTLDAAKAKWRASYARLVGQTTKGWLSGA